MASSARCSATLSASIPGLAISLGVELNPDGTVGGAGARVADDMAMLPTDTEYERRITGKTAALFATAAQTGAMLAAAPFKLKL